MEVDRGRLTGIELTENAVAVLKKRYLKKNERGEAIEEPIEMFRRVAGNIAEGEFRFKDGEEAQALYEESEERFLQMMLSRKFMPNSPTLMNAGRELQQLSACFVLPVEDSIDGIFDSLKHRRSSTRAAAAPASRSRACVPRRPRRARWGSRRGRCRSW